MIKCPLCDKDIDHVICEQICRVHWNLSVPDKCLYDYGEPNIKDIFDDSMTVFLCPECENELTNDEDEAIEILSAITKW
jgi:hypothetical protein